MHSDTFKRIQADTDNPNSVIFIVLVLSHSPVHKTISLSAPRISCVVRRHLLCDLSSLFDATGIVSLAAVGLDHVGPSTVLFHDVLGAGTHLGCWRYTSAG